MTTSLVKSEPASPHVAAYYRSGLLARVVDQKNFSFEVSSEAAKLTLPMTLITGQVPIGLRNWDKPNKIGFIYDPSKVQVRCCFNRNIFSDQIDIQKKLPLKKVGTEEHIHMPDGTTFRNFQTISQLLTKLKDEHAEIKDTLPHNELLVTAPSQAKSLSHIVAVIIPKTLLSQARGLLLIVHQMRRKIPGRSLCIYQPKSGLVELAVDSVLFAIRDLAIKKRDRRLFSDVQFVIDPRTRGIRSRL